MSISGSAVEASAFWQSAALQVRGWRVLSEGKLLQCISLLAMQPAPVMPGQWAARGLCPFHQGPAIITEQVRTKEIMALPRCHPAEYVFQGSHIKHKMGMLSRARGPETSCQKHAAAAHPSAAAATPAAIVVAARDASAAEGLDIKLALLCEARTRRGLARATAAMPAHIQAFQGLARELVEEVIFLINLLSGRSLLLHLRFDLLHRVMGKHELLSNATALYAAQFLRWGRFKRAVHCCARHAGIHSWAGRRPEGFGCFSG